MSSPPNSSSQAPLTSLRDDNVSSELGAYWPDFSWSDWDQICLESDFDSANWNDKAKVPQPYTSHASYDGITVLDYQSMKCNHVSEYEKPSDFKPGLMVIPTIETKKNLLVPFPSRKPGLRTISTPIGKFRVVGETSI